ncbi:alkaline phosphatase family protein [Candidatus Methanoperedens nitratireducens]|uniref:alkaline phosphatase family protein n=1 Tax=Candidatus Methanoperedens nitratireducens TaxID=1392998 RepID=UPI0015CE342C|nr:alkaline phosphatase family protein [Candidatus Methanoperedens nitroreducens]
MDKNHPNHDPELEKKYGSAIFQVYKNVDDVVGKILQNITDDVSVIVMSDHGVGPLYKYVYFNNFLLDKGLMKIKGDFFPQLKYWLFKRGFTVDNCLKIIPRKMILSLLENKKNNKTDNKNVGGTGSPSKKKRLKRLSIPNPFLSYSDVDWSQTKAYSIGFISPIYINLNGREPYGIVQKGDEYKKVIEEVTNELNQIKDPDTNENILDYVLTKEVFSGKYSDNAPDIAVIMKDMAYIGRDVNAYFPPFFSAFRTNKLMEPSVIQDISGTHRMNGIVILTGNNIKKNFILKGAEIEDIAPTILYLMGLPIPKDMDGKVLLDAFNPMYTENNPVRYTDILDKADMNESTQFSEDDEAKIRERLKNLGYLS